jgi:DNA mismatch repair protein MutS
MLKYCHFKTEPNFESGEIEYRYKLEDGLGDSLYGVEIAEAMGLDKSTCETAYQLRTRLQSPGGVGKRSRYNAGFFLRYCQIDDCDEVAMDTHHIKEQNTADENGMIDNHHKNIRHNLLGLCKQHHNDVHHNKIRIIGFVSTTSGPKLRYETINK